MWTESKLQLIKDKYLGPVVKIHGVVTIKPSPKSAYFSDLADAIISQQLSGKAAATIFSRLKILVRKTGLNPASILALTDDQFRSVGLSRQKTSYLRDLSQRVSEGNLELNRLTELDDQTVSGQLTAVKGIGRWTAEMFLMFTLGRPDIFPVDDLGIRKAVLKLLKLNRVNPGQLAQIGERWKPYRTAASWYLWRTLEQK